MPFCEFSARVRMFDPTLGEKKVFLCDILISNILKMFELYKMATSSEHHLMMPERIQEIGQKLAGRRVLRMHEAVVETGGRRRASLRS